MRWRYPGVCPAPGAQGRSRCRGMPGPRALARAALPGSAPPPPPPGSLCLTHYTILYSYRRRFPLPSQFGVQRAHAQGPRFGWFWRFLHDHQPPLRLFWASLPPFVPFGSSAVRYIVALTGFPLPSPKCANFTQFAIDLNEARWISKMVHWKATSKGFPTCHL